MDCCFSCFYNSIEPISLETDSESLKFLDYLFNKHQYYDDIDNI